MGDLLTAQATLRLRRQECLWSKPEDPQHKHKRDWASQPTAPALQGRDRRIPGAHWPTSLASNT